MLNKSHEIHVMKNNSDISVCLKLSSRDCKNTVQNTLLTSIEGQSLSNLHAVGNADYRFSHYEVHMRHVARNLSSVFHSK